MKHIIFIAAFLFSIFASAQESRIALVIGNANYEKGKLKNPVNDALLMQATLQNLGFDVMLDTNITSRDEFYTLIDTFLVRRSNYDIAFIYYAGHAVQINGENYMLATHEAYSTERDVRNLGMNINELIVDYQKPLSNKISVLILDACRNNPFEQSWTPQNRSLENGLGLAEIKNLPSGTIIAYSTQPGFTASDGKDKNSLYCKALAKNLLLEGVRIEDVFSKIKTEVRSFDGQQNPTISVEWEGPPLYLRKTDLTNHIIEIDSLIDAENINSFNTAREKISALLALNPNDKRCLLRKGRLELYNEEIQYDGSDLFKADKLFPNDYEVKLYLARFYRAKGELDKALSEINHSIALNPENPKSYEWKIQILLESGDTTEALECYSKIIDLEKNNPKSYENRAYYFIEKGDFDNALIDLNKAIQLAPQSAIFYNDRADLYNYYKNEPKKAIQDYETAFLLSEDNFNKARALHNKAMIIDKQGDFKLAIEEYSKVIELTPDIWNAFSNRAKVYLKTGQKNLALLDLNKAIELDLENTERYNERAEYFISQEQYESALKDLDRTIELNPNDANLYNNRADFYDYYLNKPELAIADYTSALELAADNYEKSRALNNRALIYSKEGKIDLAIDGFSDAIKEFPNPIYYDNRADLNFQNKLFDLAIMDYTKAIELEKTTPERYYLKRANFYIQQKKYTNALLDLDKAIDLSPTAYCYNNRAAFYMSHLNDKEKAIKDYEKAIKLTSDPYEKSRSENNLGLIYADQEKYELAIEKYESSIQLDPENWTSYSNRADSYSKLEKFDLALQDHNKCIELDNSNPYHYISRGDFYSSYLNKPIEALVDYSIALTLDSSNSSSWWRRGLLLSNKFNDHKSAIADFIQIVKLDTNDVGALNWIGVFYNRMLDYDNATKYYNKVISKIGTVFTDSVHSYGSIAWAYNNLGNKFKIKEDKTLANTYYQNAVKYDSSNPEFHDYRAWFLELYLKNHSEALLSINKSIELEKENPKWHLNKAKILLHSKDISNAEKSFKIAVEKSNKSQKFISELANFYSVIEDYSKADKLFEEAFKSDSVIASVYHLKTEHLIRQKNLTEALNIAHQSQTKFKNDTVSFEQLGRIFMSKKDYLKALQAYEHALSIMEFNEEYRTNSDEILEVYSSDICVALYEIYIKLNDFQLACSMLEKAENCLKAETRPDFLELEEKIKSLKQNCTD